MFTTVYFSNYIKSRVKEIPGEANRAIEENVGF